MKKLYSIFSLLAISATAFAQTIPGGDMETWRTSTSGGVLIYPTRTIQAPYAWFGLDSLIIADGETAALTGIGNGNNYYPQVFEESTIVHGGSHSAKMITRKQDTLGYFPGSIDNYHTSVNLSTFARSYWGGLPVTSQMHSVSAWVQYKSGSTSIADTGILFVQAIADMGGYDSVIGTGTANIYESTTWQQVTATINYIAGSPTPDTIRISFLSSNGTNVDSSTLYVDDVSILSSVGVSQTIMTNELVDIYPNPASNTINVQCNNAAILNLEIYAVSGQLVAAKRISGTNTIDATNLASGLYFYNIYDHATNIVQKGKISIVH